MIPNSSRTRLLRENSNFAEQTRAGSMVLDAGAGEAPYKHLFSHARYESADFCSANRNYVKPTYECDLAQIPVESGRYDAVLFNQVMEHLPEPLKVLHELYRVLKPGGRLIYSAPLFFEQHEEPYDFYRYTSHGATYLLEKAGFRVERLDWLEGYFGTVAYQLKGMARDVPLNLGGGVGIIAAPLVVAFKALATTGFFFFSWLEERRKHTGSGYPKNYVAIVSKP